MSTLHKSPTSKDGRRRKPVLLHKDGTVTPTVTTPQRAGLICAYRDRILFFEVGKWASDAGFPKLRWV